MRRRRRKDKGKKRKRGRENRQGFTPSNSIIVLVLIMCQELVWSTCSTSFNIPKVWFALPFLDFTSLPIALWLSVPLSEQNPILLMLTLHVTSIDQLHMSGHKVYHVSEVALNHCFCYHSVLSLCLENTVLQVRAVPSCNLGCRREDTWSRDTYAHLWPPMWNVREVNVLVVATEMFGVIRYYSKTD